QPRHRDGYVAPARQVEGKIRQQILARHLRGERQSDNLDGVADQQGYGHRRAVISRDRRIGAHCGRQCAKTNPLTETERQDRKTQRCPNTPAFHKKTPVQGNRIDAPVVPRDSRSRCAFWASFRGYFWLTGIFTLPLEMTSKVSAASFNRSS